jgi:8-oxo-dGTP pyrophosphatase MutT (NUDIX family)
MPNRFDTNASLDVCATAAEGPAMSDIPVIAVDRLELRFAPRAWPFADERRAAIDAHFAALRRAKPALWNGRVLVLHHHELAGARLSGAYLETDFASFIAWRDWGWPDRSVHNCFGLAALRAADGAFLLGVMAEHTANAGRIYFPGGTPDPNDVFDGAVDLDASVLRELAEETGIGRHEISAEAGWHATLSGPRIGLLKIVRSPLPAETLRDRVRAYLRRQAEPELSDLRIVRGPQDLHPQMPNFVTAFLVHVWGHERSRANA